MSRVGAVLVVLVVGSSLTGCVAAHETMLTKKKFAPVAREDVQIYLEEKDVNAPYEKIALLHIEGEANWTNERNLWNAAKKKAGKLGANGLIMGSVNEPSSGSKVAAAIFGVPVNRKGQATAIRVGPALAPPHGTSYTAGAYRAAPVTK